MRSVRVFYKKKNLLRFVSHLDMNRLMPRIIRKTNIPVWYTEGFNSHVYINFALPLSLGFESDYEALDFKVTDDGFSNEAVFSELSRVMPEHIEIIKVADPVFKPGKIAFAKFRISFEDGGAIANSLEEFLKAESITVLKKTKKGTMKEVELADKIARFSIKLNVNTQLEVVLSAGADNINPQLLLSAFESFCGEALPDLHITRTMLYTEDLEEFC